MPTTLTHVFSMSATCSCRAFQDGVFATLVDAIFSLLLSAAPTTGNGSYIGGKCVVMLLAMLKLGHLLFPLSAQGQLLLPLPSLTEARALPPAARETSRCLGLFTDEEPLF